MYLSRHCKMLQHSAFFRHLHAIFSFSISSSFWQYINFRGCFFPFRADMICRLFFIVEKKTDNPIELICAATVCCRHIQHVPHPHRCGVLWGTDGHANPGMPYISATVGRVGRVGVIPKTGSRAVCEMSFLFWPHPRNYHFPASSMSIFLSNTLPPSPQHAHLHAYPPTWSTCLHASKAFWTAKVLFTSPSTVITDWPIPDGRMGNLDRC